MTVASGALLALFIENLVPVLARHGLLYAICDDGAWTQRLELLYYLNYLVKYWELADTVFLVLKKKPLGRALRAHFFFFLFFLICPLKVQFMSVPLPGHSGLLLGQWIDPSHTTTFKNAFPVGNEEGGRKEYKPQASDPDRLFFLSAGIGISRRIML